MATALVANATLFKKEWVKIIVVNGFGCYIVEFKASVKSCAGNKGAVPEHEVTSSPAAAILSHILLAD